MENCCIENISSFWEVTFASLRKLGNMLVHIIWFIHGVIDLLVRGLLIVKGRRNTITTITVLLEGLLYCSSLFLHQRCLDKTRVDLFI